MTPGHRTRWCVAVLHVLCLTEGDGAGAGTTEEEDAAMKASYYTLAHKHVEKIVQQPKMMKGGLLKPCVFVVAVVAMPPCAPHTSSSSWSR